VQVDDEPADPGGGGNGASGSAEKADILIVDDLPEKLLVFQTVLESLDQNLVLVHSGADALRQVLQREFAVILLDVNMPGIDGFETAALIRQHRRGAHTPIIFITSYADEMQTARGYSLGAVDYILSPVVPEVLRSKVSVFVSLYLMQRQVQRQADARAAVMAAQAARRVAEENDRRSAFLAHASRALSGSLEVPVAMDQLIALLVPEIAPLAVVLLTDPELGDDALILAAAGPGGLQVARAPQAQLTAGVRTALLDAVDAGARRAMAPADLQQLGAASFGLRMADANVPALRSAAAVPLIAGGRTLGAILAAFGAEPQRSGDAQAGMLDEVAARAATAFENARLYRILQHEILERQAAQEELQLADQRKDEFLAMMSHELRNPLAPIHTAVEVIRRIAAPDPKINWALDIVSRQLRQMTRLIEELLDVVRISQGKIVLKREPMDLNAAIAHSVETVQPSIDGRRQRLHLTMTDRPVWLHGDAARLTQVIANLLHNASKYSPEETEITLASQVENGTAVISVRDQGIGIDPELRPRIFDLFAQGKRGLDRAQGGLGVGLTLARRLTEMHGGRIEALSEGRDRGSEFRVYLPCLAMVGEAASSAPVPAARPAPGPGALRILVVDDNRDAAEGTAAVLEMEGHEVRMAADGEAALAAASDFRPDVVVLDIGLPLLDGYEVAHRLRRAPATQSVFLIALTGYGQKEDRQAAQDAGFDRHFVKPADPAALLACIHEWQGLSLQRGDAA
jgi:signal transduction histidine kinase/DNA-binding response OmpR family regulator